ncbi:MAG: spermidine synthase [Chloroflexota bacterium]
MADAGEPRESARRVDAVRREGQFALQVDGMVQSVLVDGPEIGRGYWPAMLPRSKPGSALILGLGGGTIAHLLTLRYGALPIVGVDDDPAVLALAHRRFGLDALTDLRVVVGDAFAYAADCRERFDYVAVDLFRAGEIPRAATATAFLRDVRRLLTPEGLATFNLARDGRAASRIHRLGRVFYVEGQILMGFNVVVHCRPPARPVRSPER